MNKKNNKKKKKNKNKNKNDNNNKNKNKNNRNKMKTKTMFVYNEQTQHRLHTTKTIQHKHNTRHCMFVVSYHKSYLSRQCWLQIIK